MQLPQLKADFTHSAAQCFKTCQRKYFLQYVAGLRPAHKSDALRIGSAFHLGLEHAKAGADESAVETVINAEYDAAPCPPWFTPEQYEVERETAIGMAQGWMRRWAEQNLIETVAVEVAFDLPLRTPSGRAWNSIRNRGKIDWIGRLPDNRLAIIEHKTAGEDIEDLAGDYFKRLLMDSQISRYYMAARELGYDVQTVVYDVARKPLIRPKAVSKADRAYSTSTGNYLGMPLTGECPERETPTMYRARLLSDMQERPNWYFQRAEIPRLDGDLEEFALETWVLARRIREAANDQEQFGLASWPRNDRACLMGYRCEFLDCCRGLTGDPTEQVPDGFVRVDELHPELAKQETSLCQL